MATTPSPRWRRRKDDRPAEILSAALQCFSERGFAATRLEDVAKRAGVTKGTLYLYFANKEALFEAMVRQSIVPLLASREEMIDASTASSAELLTALLMSFPEAIIDQPITAIPKIVLSEAGNFPALAKFYNEEVLGRGRRLVRKLIERGIARGEFRPVDLDNIFFCVMAPVVVSMLWKHSLGRHDPKGLDARALCRTHLDLLLRGLTRDAGKP
jgi:AcrR family transcriptional regulator